MFSFTEKGSIKPIAEIKSKDELNGKILYLHRKDPRISISKPYFDEITLPFGGKFEWIPDIREDFTDVVTISAPRGAGKSTKAAELATKIKKVFKLNDDDIIVVKKSKIDDPAFDKLNPTYLYVNEEFLENPPSIEEVSNQNRLPKVIILDDLDTIASNKLKQAYVKFQDQLLEEGRKLGLYIILCIHKMADHKNTKAVLSESTYFLFFPENLTSDYRYVLNRYADMSLDLIRDLKNTNSPWILFHQHSPRFILTENKAFIYDIDREKERIDEEKQNKKEKRLLKRIPY